MDPFARDHRHVPKAKGHCLIWNLWSLSPFVRQNRCTFQGPFPRRNRVCCFRSSACRGTTAEKGSIDGPLPIYHRVGLSRVVCARQTAAVTLAENPNKTACDPKVSYIAEIAKLLGCNTHQCHHLLISKPLFLHKLAPCGCARRAGSSFQGVQC